MPIKPVVIYIPKVYENEIKKKWYNAFEVHLLNEI